MLLIPYSKVLILFSLASFKMIDKLQRAEIGVNYLHLHLSSKEKDS